MSLKVLTVDDSKAVRIIVRKTFRPYDCQVLEAANGVEGLAMAAKEKPDIILLDVTMPVMDGVEMLTKLKSDPALKNIPVLMLTAEAGRQAVMKIAKLGIRDYVVKPFKEDVVIEKVGRVIDLRPVAEGGPKIKTLQDSINIVVVEDKPAIIEQIRQGLQHMPWKIAGVASTGETIDTCHQQLPDLIVISLSLADDAAFTIYRMLRANNRTKYVPIFGLAVKTDLEIQQKAQQLGFTNLITKPINFADLESKIGKAINLDTSSRYFTFEEDYLIVHLPGNLSSFMLTEVDAYLKGKISEAVDKGFYKVIFDLSQVGSANMELIKLLVQTKEVCSELTLGLVLIADETLIAECKGYEESRLFTFFNSIDEAKAAPVGA